MGSKKPIVLYNRDWHKGIIGIVASRLSELYFRPSVVLTYSGDGLATGSSRSVRGFDIYGAIKSNRDLLENFGGHTNAVGLTLKEENIPEFKRRLEEYVENHIEDEQVTPSIDVDCELSFDEINDSFIRYMKLFNPFGPENQKPVFMTCRCHDAGTSKLVGKKLEHIKLDVIDSKSGKMMNYGGIDIYYNMTWQEFSTNYRSDYQVVIIDFGTYTNAFQKQKNGQDYRPICIQCAKKYLVFDPSPWRLSVLEKLVPLLDSDSDPNCQIEMLAPLTMKKDLKKYGLYARVGNREIHCLPNTEDPVRGGRDAMANEVRPLVLSK